MPISSQKKRAIRKMVDDCPDEVMDALLEQPFWPRDVKTGVPYSRVSDDTDGGDPRIIVAFGPDGDAWVEVTSIRSEDLENFQSAFMHRFRTGFGGGSSPRVRTAFMILARAIQLDQRDNPDRE